MRKLNRRRRNKAINNRANTDMNRLTSLERWDARVEIVANLTIICALALALWTYQSDQLQSRQVASYDMLSRFNSGELLTAQTNIRQTINLLPLEQLRDVVVPRDMMETMLTQLVGQETRKEGFDQDVIMLVGFYDQVQVCVQIGACDEHVIQAHLGETAKRHACILMPYVRKLRAYFLIDDLGDSHAILAKYEANC
jgi:hypothetical protein